MEFKGTKGKFEVIEHSWSHVSLVCNGETIATQSIYEYANEENQEELETEVLYNFRLLSKAPEMLEMLQYFVNNNMLSVTGEEMAKQLIKEATEL